MAGWTNELKVGLLTIATILGAIWAIQRTDDRPLDGVSSSYNLYMVVPSADGIYPTTQVKMAGVSIGSVRRITLEGTSARVLLEMNAEVQLPIDSLAELKSEGVLGDKFVRITPGESPQFLEAEAIITNKPVTFDTEKLSAQADEIAASVEAITADTELIVRALRMAYVDNGLQDHVTATVLNVEAMSHDLRIMASENRQDLAVIADNLRNLSVALNELVAKTGDSVGAEMDALRAATTKLDETMTHVNAITSRVEAGEGTLGRLVNDDTTIDRIDRTLGEVGEVVESINRVQTEVYYRGDYFVGTDPSADGFAENPVAGGTRSTFGLRLMPREDYWYQVEVVDHPIGSFTWSEQVDPETGGSARRYTVTPDLRYSLQFARRWKDLTVRFGVKESSGGVGVDYNLLRDRLVVSADLYDFSYGSWPLLDGTPNLTLGGRFTPAPHVYLSGGLDNTILGLRYGYVTGFVGGGFSFTDDDIKWLLATVPFPG